MGLDAYIYRARNKRIFRSNDWYIDENANVTEVWYTRKFWDLINNMSFIKNVEEDCGEYIPLTKENVEEMLQYATHNPDYFNGFTTVPALCEILHKFDDDADEGWHYYFEFDY